MFVEETGPIHIERDPADGTVTVMLSDYFLSLYNRVKNKVALVLGATSVEMDSNSIHPLANQLSDFGTEIVQTANHLLGMLAVDYGPMYVQICARALVIALVIHELAGRIVVCGYEIVTGRYTVGTSKVGGSDIIGQHEIEPKYV